ncbi:DMP19 family protein [Breznakiella homolactica]|uniref:DMP19 family protein n=2 Tax=Breznakiella homolactica TaxID=2798577 RepID=A0A7T8BDM3_9SPIR|nr:DMP19 family protein [Breznakiella homolactica]
MKEFSDSQHTLLAYNYLYGQVCNGGFIQLIQNGYGGYIFNNPLAETLRSWGLEKVPDILDEAKVIYEKHKTKLEKETSLEEFSELYTEITDFDSLESRFFEVMDNETGILQRYVKNHITGFAVIV